MKAARIQCRSNEWGVFGKPTFYKTAFDELGISLNKLGLTKRLAIIYLGTE